MSAHTEKGVLAPADRGERPLVGVRGVSKTFGATRALTDVSLDVLPGRTRALLGRNGAGKSTLVSSLTGLAAPDTGHVEFDGTPAPSRSDKAAWQRAVACVYQRSTVVPSLSVAENLFLNRQPRGRHGISWKRTYGDAAELLDLWSIEVRPRATVGSLSVGNRQMVEIARALSTGCRFIILDEPTAKLDAREIRALFKKMRVLQQAGVTFLYISHHLQEIFEVCQDVTVLRDGRVVGEGSVDRLSTDDIVEMMTGGAHSLLEDRGSKQERPIGDVRLRLDGLSSTKASEPFRDVDLEVRAGEIVGLAGIDGSGKLGVAQVVTGLAPGSAGRVHAGGRSWTRTSMATAMGAGIAYVPQDRQTQGIVPTMSIADNLTLSGTGRDTGRGFVRPVKRVEAARNMVQRLDIKLGQLSDPITSLSGGNQQKVLLGRAMQVDPTTLVLVAPTAGVDVASKVVLLAAVTSAADDRAAVLVVSDDIDDLRICDRVLVMFDGRLITELGAGFKDAALVATMEGVPDRDQDHH